MPQRSIYMGVREKTRLRIKHMTKTPDYTAMFKDMMGKFPVDMSAFEDAYKAQAAFGEKMSAVALEAAMKSAEISSAWTKASLEKVADLSKVNADPAAAAQTLTDFASASAEMAAENMAAMAGVAKKVQLDSAELMMAAGKEVSAEATAAMKKAGKAAKAA
jgi:hypothetical protein